MKFLIVTATYRRNAMLERFVGAVRAQTHADWKLSIAHDGPGRAFRRDWGDPRIVARATARHVGDDGVTPRHAALTAGAAGCEYVVFWDDDNLFFPHALASIAHALARRQRPDALLVPFHFGDRVLPASGAIRLRGVDTANLVIKTDIALARFPHEGCHQFDYLYFRALAPVETAPEIAPIGRYDGLRAYTRFPALLRPGLYLTRVPALLRRKVARALSPAPPLDSR